MMVTVEELFSRLRHEVDLEARRASVACGRCGEKADVHVQQGMNYVVFHCPHCGGETIGKIPQ